MARTALNVNDSILAVNARIWVSWTDKLGDQTRLLLTNYNFPEIFVFKKGHGLLSPLFRRYLVYKGEY